jgi:signal peptidase I
VPAWRTLLDWAGTTCLALALVLIFEAEVAKPYRIPSSSMEPTLHCAKPGAWCEGRFSDRVIVNRLAYRFQAPSRGQMVIFRAPPRAAGSCGEGGTFVKRLVGLPGEVVQERAGRVLIDGRPLREPYVDPALRGTGDGTWRVPRGSYFFMGDDRAHSCDSRTWGPVPRRNLIGPVLFTYWPPGRFAVH